MDMLIFFPYNVNLVENLQQQTGDIYSWSPVLFDSITLNVDISLWVSGTTSRVMESYFMSFL